MYVESNQKIEIAIIITAKINPGIAIPINAMKSSLGIIIGGGRIRWNPH